MSSRRVILPGSTIGVLGSGQLGRMFAIAARRMGYRVHVLSPQTDTPTGQVADVEIEASYDDDAAVSQFAREVQVVTFEFENVPATAIAAAVRHAPVRPRGEVLHITQHRLREKTFLSQAGLPVTPFVPVRSALELRQGLAALGGPGIVKTASWGYDGKGQSRVDAPHQAESAWQQLSTDEAILEARIDFVRELSIVAARSIDGEFVHYGPIANVHVDHILDLSVLPAPVAPRVAARAVEIARAAVEALDVVGVLCVELFQTADDELLINETAPRPHNSGHLTIDAALTCQFEQQLRAVCGLPLGSPRILAPAAMVNLLGDLWQHGPPDWERMCGQGDVKLHLYGKREARPGRKMGHLTVLADTPQAAADRALEARALLKRG